MGLPARLTDPWFDAEFFGEVSPNGRLWRHHHDDGSPMSFAEAQGLFLWCPCGFGALDKDGKERWPLDLGLNLGRPHGLLLPFANPPSSVPLPENFGPSSRDGKSKPRWTVSGSGLHDLRLSPSIAVGNPECWHGYIGLNNPGEVT